jgi:phosphoglycolate phosphatase-like HAD superfamily hydrolase
VAPATVSRAIAVDLDGALGDTRPLWNAFLDDASRRFASIAALDVSSLPEDRAQAAVELDRWAKEGVGDWRAALVRFAEDHVPVYLRPSAPAAAALRQLASRGWRLGVYTDAPEELARIALAHVGAARRVELIEAGEDARERLLVRLGDDAIVAATLDELVAAAAVYDRTP